MVGFGDQVPVAKHLKVATDSSEYDDWDVPAGCEFSKFLRGQPMRRGIAVGITDDQVGLFAISNGPSRLESVGFEDLPALSIQQRSQDVARLMRGINEQDSGAIWQRTVWQRIILRWQDCGGG